MSGTGVLQVLTSQQRAAGWRRQSEVETSLGLEKGAIKRYFQRLGQAHLAEWTTDARLQLEMAGVYRVEGLRRGKPLPPKNWWIAFAGKGNPRPALDLSKESHPFAPEQAPGEQRGSPAGLAELRERGQGSPSPAVPEMSEGKAVESCTAAPEWSEGGRGGPSEGLGERIEGVRGTPPTSTPDEGTTTCMMRARWMREPALQAMMSSCTWDYFLTSDELGRFLDIDEDDLKPILSRVSPSGSGDDTFLRTCGIRSRKFNGRDTYCLLGCGNLITLGPILCMELMDVEPQPSYWGMAPRVVDESTNVMAGLGSLGTVTTVVDLSKAIQASLVCWRCDSGVGARWSFMRRESKARMILSRGEPPELGLNFECDACGSIYLGEPLPDTAVGDFEETSLSNATEAIFATLPSLYQPEFDGAPKATATQHLDAALDSHGRGGKDAQSKAVEMPVYNRAGRNHRRSEGEANMHLNTRSGGKKARPGAAQASPSSRCQTCKKRGVSSEFLATQQHYKRGKAGTCEAVQLAWSAGGSRSSLGAESETAP